ncbi:hypothetical protein [Flagellimonas sp.]|uniref:hypothetical protein n=1 Tax=Flagellimonas sp. TaxID=2058762 RepID=UPI003BAD5B50
MVANVIKDLAWQNVHTLVHGEMSAYKSIKETQKIILDLNERECNGDLDPLDLSKPVLNAYSFYKKHKSFLDD